MHACRHALENECLDLKGVPPPTSVHPPVHKNRPKKQGSVQFFYRKQTFSRHIGPSVMDGMDRLMDGWTNGRGKWSVRPSVPLIHPSSLWQTEWWKWVLSVRQSKLDGSLLFWTIFMDGQMDGRWRRHPLSRLSSSRWDEFYRPFFCFTFVLFRQYSYW